MIKQVLRMKMAYGSTNDKCKISPEKVTMINGDIKEEVYMFRFGDNFTCPLDGLVYYVTKRASTNENMNVWRRSLLELHEYSDFKYIFNVEVSVEKKLVVADGWILQNLDRFFEARKRYMNETKYPNSGGFLVPTYALSPDTRDYLRFQYLKNNLGEYCAFSLIG